MDNENSICKVDGKSYDFKKYKELIAEENEDEAIGFLKEELGYDWKITGDIYFLLIEMEHQIPEEINTETIEQELEKLKALQPPKCPNCGSASITAGQRGYTLLTGMYGSMDTVNYCMSCGHKWEPRK